MSEASVLGRYVPYDEAIKEAIQTITDAAFEFKKSCKSKEQYIDGLKEAEVVVKKVYEESSEFQKAGLIGILSMLSFAVKIESED